MPATNSCNQTITQYNVQTGATLNTLNNVAPSATSGVPLISQGAAAQPVFGTAVVAGGGTGGVTYTPYSLITAGTTATGAFQNVAGVGLSGQVLTSGGASALPTWQSTGAPSASSTFSLLDDFVVAIQTSTTMASSLGWNIQNINISTPSSSVSSGHPGVITYLGYSNGNVGYLFCSAGMSQIILGGGAFTCNWVFKINTLSDGTNTYVISIGMGDNTTSADFTNGVYFRYTSATNSGNWQIVTAKASTRTTTNSAVAATTGWHNAGFVVNAAGTSIEYFMDGVSLGTITTNIPTAQSGPIMRVGCTANNFLAGSIDVDLMYINQTLTTPR